MPPHHRPDWVVAQQKRGLMISPKEHNGHHKTYDDNFCIGTGLCNPIISWSLKNLTSNKWVWLFVFVTTLILDVPFMNYVLTEHFGFQ
jgi:hypothetical protein